MIGLVYGATFEIACAKLDKMVDYFISTYGANEVNSISRGDTHYVVTVRSQRWEAKVPGMGARYARCNVALIDKNIPQETIDEYVKPYVCLKPWTAIGYY